MFGRSRTTPLQVDAEAMHDALIAVVRQPALYLEDGVPDTFQGRFDLLVLCASVLIRRLRALGPDGQQLAQQVVDTMFARLDIAMRELGVGDITVPKRMKRLAEAFKGRTAAYDEALQARDLAGLVAAINRNVLDGQAPGEGLAHYILEAEDRFNETSLDTLRRGALPFAERTKLAAARD